MNELVKVSENKTVDARELHGFLEVASRFNDWVTSRIEDFDFKEGVDFQLLEKQYLNNIGKNAVSKDYTLSIGMAKELCMVERTDRGRQARKYFIEVEERWQRGETKLPTMTHLEITHSLAAAMVGQEKQIKTLELTAAKTEERITKNEEQIEAIEVALSSTKGITYDSDAPWDKRLGANEIAKKYFDGVSAQVVKSYLLATRHRKIFYSYYAEAVERDIYTWAFALEGIEEAARKFFAESSVFAQTKLFMMMTHTTTGLQYRLRREKYAELAGKLGKPTVKLTVANG